jgi:hypothetical protein
MRSTRLALVTAVAATSLLTASPARAEHACNLDHIDEGLDTRCESHPQDAKLIQRIFCIVFPPSC